MDNEDVDPREHTLRALSRVKKEADTLPVFFTPEGERRFRYLAWIVGGFISLIVTIITATVIIVGYKNLITQNTTDIATVKSSTATSIATVASDVATVKIEAAAAATIAKRVEEEQKRRIPQLEEMMRKMALLDNYDFKKLNELVMDMGSQRDYGISNKEWYLGKHGYPPPSNPAAQPR